MALGRIAFGDLEFAWDAGDLPLDPFAPVMPLELAPAGAARAPAHRAIALRAERLAEPARNPAERGAVPVLYHGTTRCFRDREGLWLWDGASLVHVDPSGTNITARVHSSSLARPFQFSSVTVLMAMFLALRSHGLFHLHAGGAIMPDGEVWLLPGDSGAGKSTLALALFHDGASYLSDDALLVRAGGAEPRVLAWPRLVRITPRTAAAFPALAPQLAPSPPGCTRELELDPRLAFPGRGRPAARAPFTLLFPRIGDGPRSVVTPLDRAEAFGRMLQACAWVAADQVPQRALQLEALRRVVDAARAVDVAVGRQLLANPGAAVDELRTLMRRC